ncbi:hypothetical protein AJ87_07445 [Rhizobium yanglingense]|nr:hypothetical protein AJ87_07445 [Rhizobium yanglingense]
MVRLKAVSPQKRQVRGKSRAPKKTYATVGRAVDGTRILAPKYKAKHFTEAQILATIRAVRLVSESESQDFKA